ncbi:hypothetical protein O7621_09735 [Solwaraspora sp. WMMD937]|uniref:hypothetical protein n=1 Tax=Solwaraspora sp. WMMD937 TaxID=3016090 RepID=UPI00249A3548|nr:hypothetical protein [Solwaraspora sp. WMMD937]WFE23524.1 hypothetical protein O7621_09735 [Solwaraspora sp. WMMD937]
MPAVIRNALAAALLAVSTTLVVTSAPAQAAPPDYYVTVTHYYSDSSHTNRVGTWLRGPCPDRDWDHLSGVRTPFSTSGIHPCP